MRIDWKAGNVSIALLLAAFGVAPFAVFGAFGSPTDALLGLLAGLSLGLLAAVLMESTTGNRFLDAFGIGAALTLLGSAIGYDGAQLILIALLPSFAFAAATVMPSRVAGMILTGLVTAAGFVFFDPTELTIVLGDVGALAVRAGRIRRRLGVGRGTPRVGDSTCGGSRLRVRYEAGARLGRRGRGVARRPHPVLHERQPRLLRRPSVCHHERPGGPVGRASDPKTSMNGGRRLITS
ncbi:MAG: hypothetical protein M0C28_33940 [Candidatus Moduliflexus flocculans]|nr:hypothetical protein [Candidatus Moduliflexus flocculans]